VVLTIFSNKAMPLIRYKPGDVGRLYGPDCSCDRQTPLLSVEGRLQDTIVTSERVYSAKDIIDFYDGFNNVQFAQLVQKSEKRCDLLIVEEKKGKTDLDKLVAESQRFFSGDLQIRPRFVSTIKPEVSGKFRFVKSASFKKLHDVTRQGHHIV
jgi:phenylacetate-CoA ligase